MNNLMAKVSGLNGAKASDSTNKDVIACVDELVAAGRMFTAWDVTRIVRKRRAKLGLADYLYHSDSKQVVHDHMALDDIGSDDYEKTLVPVKGRDAWVYHSEFDDPIFYDPDLLDSYDNGGGYVPVIPATGSPVVDGPDVDVVVTPIGSQDSNDGGDAFDDEDEEDDAPNHYVVAVDGRGRVCIPVAAVKTVTQSNADVLVAVTGVGSVQLYPGSKSVHGKLVHYEIDKSGNVRVSKSILSEGGIYADHVDVVVDPIKKKITLG